MNEIKTCLITGGSDGIGFATAKLFAGQGYQLAICGRTKSKLESAAQEIKASSGSEVFTIVADMSDSDQAKSVAEQTLKKFGQVNVLVNNAGAAPLAAFDEIDSAMFENVLNTNVRGVFYLTQTIWNSMRAGQGGTIVNISSLAAIDPFPGFSLYGASKAWIDLMTLALATEGQEQNIRVCSIRPGAVETKLLRGLFPDFPADQCVAPEVIAEHVWGCVSDPEKFPSGQAFAVTNQA